MASSSRAPRPPTPRALPRIDVPDLDALAALLARPTAPCVLALGRGLSALAAPLDAASLLALAPDVALPVSPTRGGRVWVDPTIGRPASLRPLALHLDALAQDPDAGYVVAPLASLPPPLASRLAPPSPLADATWSSGKLWISAPGVVTALHFDLAHNLHVVRAGRKRVLLVPWWQASRVYPLGLRASIPNGAGVDPESPDLGRFPRFSGATLLEATLGPGDALLVPRGTWHHVRSLEASVSVNHWWARGAHARVVRAADRFKQLRGLSR